MGEAICKSCLAWAMNAPENNAECVLCEKDAKVERLEKAAARLIEAIKGTTEWEEHNEHCQAVLYAIACDCGHVELHAAVKAAEAAERRIE